MTSTGGPPGWPLTSADVRVVALRALALVVVGPLLVVAYEALSSSPAVRSVAPGLGHVMPWFWRFVLFLGLAVAVPVSFVERAAARPLASRRRALAAALVAALITAPGAIVAMAQATYAPLALGGDFSRAGARAIDAMRRLLGEPPREVAAGALALAAPFAAVTYARVRAWRLRWQLAASLVIGVGVAALALHVVGGLRPREWLLRRTDLWTALCAALLPSLYVAVDGLERRFTSPPGSAASAPTSVA